MFKKLLITFIAASVICAVGYVLSFSGGEDQISPAHDYALRDYVSSAYAPTATQMREERALARQDELEAKKEARAYTHLISSLKRAEAGYYAAHNRYTLHFLADLSLKTNDGYSHSYKVRDISTDGKKLIVALYYTDPNAYYDSSYDSCSSSDNYTSGYNDAYGVYHENSYYSSCDASSADQANGYGATPTSQLIFNAGHTGKLKNFSYQTYP
jgi:hypothetical protein